VPATSSAKDRGKFVLDRIDKHLGSPPSEDSETRDRCAIFRKVEEDLIVRFPVERLAPAARS
jgi:hypothetical protein